MALKEMDQFVEIVEQIKNLVNWYENTKFKNKKMRIFLTNKDCYIYSVPEDKIAHLLGININNLQSLGLFKNTSSYLLLKEFLNNYHRISHQIMSGSVKLEYIFSKHIYKKINSFKKNISINLNDISFICKYNKEKAYNDGKNTVNCDYSIIKKLDDGSILELDLALVDNKYLYPISNKIYTDNKEAEESFKRLLENQEVAIVNSMILYNNDYDNPRKFFLTDIEKTEKLNIIKEFIAQYNCSIDLIQECEYLYKNTQTHREKNSDNYDIYETIIDCVLNGRLIPVNNLVNISSQQYELIDAINDSIIRNNINSDENTESYSKLRKSKERLLETKNQLIEENKELKEDIKNKEAEIKALTEQNNIKDTFINSITTSFNEYNEKIKVK